ncbi:hypothetical protein [Inquilinus limosus]|uniref:Uncharacterized protein n=1 Tax=Inquilinus limosus MP06 TaxID=1398085 RepID=A0A0A0D9C1_9PROT|nr:hypothetical protein [Inquilinus limosus]KGM35306.1 hypothetical protein P409_05175 [Inquilinus limosus MP06]
MDAHAVLILVIVFVAGLHLVTLGLGLAKALGRLSRVSWWAVPSPSLISWGLVGLTTGGGLSVALLMAALGYAFWAWRKPPKVPT